MGPGIGYGRQSFYSRHCTTFIDSTFIGSTSLPKTSTKHHGKTTRKERTCRCIHKQIYTCTCFKPSSLVSGRRAPVSTCTYMYTDYTQQDGMGHSSITTAAIYIHRDYTAHIWSKCTIDINVRSTESIVVYKLRQTVWGEGGISVLRQLIIKE